MASASASASAGPAWGEQLIYSTAIETYVRAVASNHGRAIGYLRVGSSVKRSDEAVGTTGCKAGWYAVEPRGFICASETATLDEKAPLVQIAKPLPGRGEPMPYVYARVKGAPPHYYFKIPTRQEQRKVEGADADGRGGIYLDANRDLLPAASEVPPLLAEGGKIPRPQGGQPRLRFGIHTGRASPNTRLALLAHFPAEGRDFALTSQMDIVPLDRMQVVRPPEFKGVVLAEGEDLPVGFVKSAAVGLKADDSGKLTVRVPYTRRQGLVLTGEQKQDHGVLMAETNDGAWVAVSSLLMVDKRKNVPSFVKNDQLRWVDIDIRSQSLVAYQGSRPVFATLVSTGTGFLGDPETTHSTPRGEFHIFAKHVSTRMTGDELGGEYQIDDVPYVQYFHKSWALHGAFWHDDFGHPHSHGCVNLSPADAAWLFEFTNPDVPAGWHGAFTNSAGSVVFIHE